MCRKLGASNTGLKRGFVDMLKHAVSAITVLRQFRKRYDAADVYNKGTHFRELADALKTKKKHLEGTTSNELVDRHR